MRFLFLTLTFALVLLVSCKKQSVEKFILSFEQDLIPEGIAIHHSSKKLFLNSLKNRKIVASALDGKHPITFLSPEKYGYLSGFGMTVKEDTLYALGNSFDTVQNQSILLLLNAKTGDLIRSYTLEDSSLTYLNDLAISSSHQIFITDSPSNRIYTIQRPYDKLEIFMDNEGVANSNGIAISDDDKYLYIASRRGIRIVDIETKTIINESNDHVGVDGLKFYHNTLIGIVNIWVDAQDTIKNGVFRYLLSEDSSKIIGKDKIVYFTEDFKVPTTFAISGNYLYFIINTQLDNFDESLLQIKDTSKLEPYVLMKKYLPHSGLN